MAEQAPPETTEVEGTAAPVSEQNPMDLTVNDLNNIKQIIDVASSRGAFRPNEMTTIGQVYTKLEAFLGTVAAAQGEKNNGA
jgi:hypothetical protein